jgi:gas vesicle protein
MNGYILFSKSIREEIGTVSHKKMSEKWHSLSNSEKNEWNLKAKLLRNKKMELTKKVKETTKKVKDSIKKWKFDKPEECPVCFESLSNQKIPLECDHWVHSKCIKKSGKAQCPICRKELLKYKGKVIPLKPDYNDGIFQLVNEPSFIFSLIEIYDLLGRGEMRIIN